MLNLGVFSSSRIACNILATLLAFAFCRVMLSQQPVRPRTAEATAPVPGVTSPNASGNLPVVLLKAHTPIEIEIRDSASSKTSRAGDQIAFVVSSSLVLDGVIVVAAGTAVTAHVESARKARHFGRTGQLLIRLDSTVAVDGTRVPLCFATRRQSRSKSNRAGEIAAGTMNTMVAIYYFPLLPLSVLSASPKGRDFVIPSGERFRVYAAEDVSIQLPSQ